MKINVSGTAYLVMVCAFASFVHAATTTSCTGTPCVKVTVTVPKGASGSPVDGGSSSVLASKTIYTPCNNAGTDQISIVINGQNSKAKPYYDLYFFIVNTSASGSSNADLRYNQFYVFRRFNHFNVNIFPAGRLPGVELFTQATSATLDKEEVLLRAEDFAKLGNGIIKETILQGAFSVDGWSLSQGTYMAVAILADRTTAVNFDNPSTWVAWDAVPIIFNSPWQTNNFASFATTTGISTLSGIQLNPPNTCD